MIGPKLCRRTRLLGLALVGPPLLWVLVVTLMPTAWARRRIERELSEATQCPARLGSVRLGLFGGVHLQRLELLEPPRFGRNGSWLRARKVRVDLGLAGLMSGHVRPSTVSVDGLQVTLGRDAAGHFNLGEMLRDGPDDEDGGPIRAAAEQVEELPIRVAVANGMVIIRDEPSATRMEIGAIEATAMVSDEAIVVEDLTGQLNGGTLTAAAQVDRGLEPTFEMTLKADRVRLGGQLPFLGYLVPFLAGLEKADTGLVDAEVELQGRGKTQEAIKASLRGRGRLVFDPLELDKSLLAEELGNLVPMSGRSRLGSLKSAFQVQDSRISATELELKLGQRSIRLAGNTGFDGTLAYELDASDVLNGLGEKAPSSLRNLAVESAGLLKVQVFGTVREPKIRINGRPLVDGEEGEGALREIARSIRQRFLR